MRFLFPAGVWGFAALAVITALYLLRRRSESVTVPSLLLWRRALAEQQAMKPFQKLKKNILYLIQMALALLLALALLRPAVSGGVQGETVLIFDLSASMQAEENGVTRLAQAVRRADALIDGMREGDRVTVLTAGTRVDTLLSRSEDLVRARSVLSGLRAENGGADLPAAVSLAQAMARDIEGLNIVVFSDSYESSDVQVARVGTGVDNRALLSLAVEEDGAAFVRAANYGADAAITLECEADGALCDVAVLELKEGQTGAAVLRAPAGAQTVRVSIAEPDALQADNARWYTARENGAYRAALFGENVFLEKAAALRSDLTLLRADAREAAALEEIDLYIFDGELPDTLPEQGMLLCVAAEAPVLGIVPGEEKEASGAFRAGGSDLARELTEHLLLEDIALRSCRPLTGGQEILRRGGDTLLAVAEENGRRAAVLGFDLHDSSLPMKGDFPILIQNLLAWLLPDARQALPDGVCGQAVRLPVDPQAQAVSVTLPSGRTLQTDGVLEKTGEQGVYTAIYAYPDGQTRQARFCMHMENAESDLRAEKSENDTVILDGGTDAGRALTPWVLLACLILLLLEWGVSRRVA